MTIPELIAKWRREANTPPHIKGSESDMAILYASKVTHGDCADELEQAWKEDQERLKFLLPPHWHEHIGIAKP